MSEPFCLTFVVKSNSVNRKGFLMRSIQLSTFGALVVFASVAAAQTPIPGPILNYGDLENDARQMPEADAETPVGLGYAYLARKNAGRDEKASAPQLLPPTIAALH